MPSLDGVPELVRVDFRSHNAIFKGLSRSLAETCLGSISDRPPFEWLTDILPEQHETGKEEAPRHRRAFRSTPAIMPPGEVSARRRDARTRGMA